MVEPEKSMSGPVALRRWLAGLARAVAGHQPDVTNALPSPNERTLWVCAVATLLLNRRIKISLLHWTASSLIDGNFAAQGVTVIERAG
jgi:hypothetical protein